MILDGGFTGDEAAGGYVIERSLRFNAASSQYLTRTPSVAGNQRTWTFSCWVKRGTLNSVQAIFDASIAGVWFNLIGFTASNNLTWFNGDGAGDPELITTAVYRDTSAWLHIVFVYDSTNATASERTRLFVNGTRITSFTTQVNASLNEQTTINQATAHHIGRRASIGDGQFDGYIADPRFIDGQALDASSFGEISTATGQWAAKRYAGAYGTNGSYPDFKDGTSTTTLGYDKSGNNNHWTLTNFTRSAGVNDCWMLDVPAGNGSASAVQPSGNYAVLNPLDTGGTAPLNGNLTLTAGAVERGVRSTFAVPTTGLYYAEAVVGTNQSGATDIAFGFVARTTNLSANPFNISNGWSIYGAAITYITRNGTNTLAGAGTALVAGDILQIAIDLANNKGWIGKNNTWFNGSTGTDGNPSTGANPTFTFSGTPELFVLSHVYSSTINVNFGQRSFAYTPPTGFKALCTANLPVPTIKKPSDHFNVQLSTGANIKTDSEALFTNELEWIKDRANANNHQLIDSVRGSSAVLQSNTTAAETTYTAPSGSSVGWVWRASDSAAVTNNVGTISSQVSANPTAGFSIVKFNCNNTPNQSIGHGLGIAPKVVILKDLVNGTYNWNVWFTGFTASEYIVLNSAGGKASAAGLWNQVPDSTRFYIGSEPTGVNTDTDAMVAYCFAEIAGYSKFGSYTGNGSADGTNVTLGFKPRFIMTKRIDTTGDWLIHDTSRDSYNVGQFDILPHLSIAEQSNVRYDINSNGFKIRESGVNTNASGGTYIYMAFAETPFNYANAR